MESLMFLVQKKDKDKTIKARTCANGSIQRAWMQREDATSPTASLESIILTSTIEAHENRDVATIDVPNAFIQTEVEYKEGEEWITLKVQGVLVDMLVKMEPEIYKDRIVYENGKKTIYMIVLKAIYGMLQLALLFYQQFKKDLEEYGFIFNPYDPCVANKMVNGKQLTITFHVDDLKASHKDSKVIDKFIEWVDKNMEMINWKIKIH